MDPHVSKIESDRSLPSRLQGLILGNVWSNMKHPIDDKCLACACLCMFDGRGPYIGRALFPKVLVIMIPASLRAVPCHLY